VALHLPVGLLAGHWVNRGKNLVTSEQGEAGTASVRQAGIHVLISLLLLIPCFWQTHIEAGDLASHIYNAWLASLTHQGRVAGLQLAPESTNFLFDVLAQHLGATFGFAVAEKLIVSAFVLLFFWGSHTLVSAFSGRPAWGVVPLLVLTTYSWTFQMGFMNFYAAIAFALWGLAFWWKGNRWRYVVPGAAILAWLSHPMGVAFLFGAIFVTELFRSVDPKWLPPIVVALISAIVGLRFWISEHYRIITRSSVPFYQLTGANQFILYRGTYAFVGYSVVLLLGVSIAAGYLSTRSRAPASRSVALALIVLVLIACWVFPNGLFLPQYPGPLNFLTSRLTLLLPVLGAALWAMTQVRAWQVAAFSLLAAVYLGLLYSDTLQLSKTEDEAEVLVRQLPLNSRVVGVLEWPGSQVVMHHILDRACIGHCFSYANYEPPSGQFRLRVAGPNPIILEYPAASDAVQQGKFLVQVSDLPLYQLYQCGSKTQLCVHQLQAGELNGQIVRERGWLARKNPQ
jgi:hypothetical protein